ncbi:MAG: S8 family serine peptidase [Thermoanaerobaculia bacterium]
MKIEVRAWVRRTACGLALACLTIAAPARAADPYEIRLIQQTWTPRAGVTPEAERALVDAAAVALRQGRSVVHALVQLHEIPDDSQRAALQKAGLELGDPLPGRAWIASVEAAQAAAVAELPGVRWIEPWTAARKQHPRLTAGDVASWARDPKHPGWIMTMVHLHQDAELSRGEELAARLGGVALPPLEGVHALTVWLPESKIAELAQDEDVLWIEEGAPPLAATNDGIRKQMKVDTVAASPYGLDGEGVRLLVFDSGRVRGSHVTFDAGNGSRVTALDASPLLSHATHVAGTAAGDGSGSAGGRGRGVAPLSKILSAGYEQISGNGFWDNAGDLENDYALARNSHEADLVNNSLNANVAFNGDPCSREGDYGVTSRLLDRIVRGDDAKITGPMLMVWANGNERWPETCGVNYHTTGEPACAKNPLQIGAIHSDGGAMTDFSSWGPCDDGRLKPTVVAPGCETGRVTGEKFILSAACGEFADDAGADCSSDTLYAGEDFCGTSMASPAVTGTLALLLQDWRAHQPFFLPSFGPLRMMPALVKAMVVHTARDLGVAGPDYRSGYGAVDAKALIDLERGGASKLGAQGTSVWGTDTVTNRQVRSYTINVPAGVAELKATLAWDDVAAQTLAATALVNDLDLELVGPDNTVHQTWVLDPANPYMPATIGDNQIDNQEQAVVKNPQASAWTVRVTGAAVPQGPQSFGLVYTATPRQYDEAACAVTDSTFESGNDGWTLSNAVRVAAPAPGHGAFSMQLVGANSTVSEVSRTLTLPNRHRAEATFFLYVTTTEFLGTRGNDTTIVEVRDAAGVNLAVLELHDGGDLTGVWMPQRVDLTPWAGMTIQLIFRARTNDKYPATFWIDDIQVKTCPPSTDLVQVSIASTGALDGYVKESSETSSVGGTAYSNNATLYGQADFLLGDNDYDEQVKGFLSFDTSTLPDTATIVSARLVLNRSYMSGTNPFTTHGTCRVDIRTGGFNNNAALEPADFQAVATGLPASILSSPALNGDTAWATLNGEALTAVSKTGITQFRLYFSLGDNDDMSADVLYFTAGEDPTPRLRPRLEVTYLP